MKIKLLTGAFVLVVTLVLFFGLYQEEEFTSPETVTLEEFSAVTFEGQPKAEIEEDEMTRRLRKFGLDGGIATVESKYKNQ